MEVNLEYNVTIIYIYICIYYIYNTLTGIIYYTEKFVCGYKTGTGILLQRQQRIPYILYNQL